MPIESAQFYSTDIHGSPNQGVQPTSFGHWENEYGVWLGMPEDYFRHLQQYIHRLQCADAGVDSSEDRQQGYISPAAVSPPEIQAQPPSMPLSENSPVASISPPVAPMLPHTKIVPRKRKATVNGDVNPPRKKHVLSGVITDPEQKRHNEELVRLRAEGMSFKEIKKILRLKESESTLRGRYRTLTKPKSQRQRKPQWTDIDIQLLIGLVDPTARQVRWKVIADEIYVRGGSYHFGTWTCKQKYMRLAAEGRALPLTESAAKSAKKRQRRR